jgi:SAM-dependent methyltransferase
MIRYLARKVNVLETALRRANNPNIKSRDLIIDIGSGGMPYPRATVACDFYENDFERADLLKIDRPFVWASVDYLPFAEKTFDFSIFSHVLEHLLEPAKSLKEVERVSKAGYIETPNAFYEFIIPHSYHMSRCTIIDDVLNVTMKKSWEESLPPEFMDVHTDMMAGWHGLNAYDSKVLLTKYYWKDKIRFTVHGSVGFVKPIDQIQYSETKRPFWKKILKDWAYILLRPQKIILENILKCPKCKGELVYKNEMNEAYCDICQKTYTKHRGCWDFRITG